ncbi:hypothetical protein PIB30_114590, partial [Stylosanthes scabra]|nr:hypothetical protein [Stylosanthes scabra]
NKSIIWDNNQDSLTTIRTPILTILDGGITPTLVREETKILGEITSRTDHLILNSKDNHFISNNNHHFHLNITNSSSLSLNQLHLRLHWKN